MTHTVVTTFPTKHRRFHAGATITELDCDSPEQFKRMVELGVIAKSPAKPEAAAVATTPVATAEDDPPPEAA